MENLISVIMSTYNEEAELVTKSINSVLEQTYTDIEFIIVLDNPHNEQLKNLLLSYKDSRIKLLFNDKNLGLVKSLNRALNLCRGKYIARMDADDVSKKERLEVQRAFLEENDFDFIFTNVDYIDEKGNNLYKGNSQGLTASQVRKSLARVNISNHPTWFLKKEVYESLNGYRDIEYCEDYDFSLRALGKGYTIGKMGESTLFYRIRGNSISRSNALQQFLNMRGLSKLYNKGEIENISDVERMKEKSKRLSTVKENNKFNKSSYYFNRGIESFRGSSKLKGSINITKSLFISKYHNLKFYDLLQYKKINS